MALAVGREHQMVQHGQVDRLASLREDAGRAAVGFARPGVAAGVIMREDDTGATEASGIGNDCPDRQIDRSGLAIEAIEMNAAGACIDMSDP